MEKIKVRFFIERGDDDEFAEIMRRFGLADGQFTMDELENIWYDGVNDDVYERYCNTEEFEKMYEFDSFDEFFSFYNEVSKLKENSGHYDYATIYMGPDVVNRCLEMTIQGGFYE